MAEEKPNQDSTPATGEVVYRRLPTAEQRRRRNDRAPSSYRFDPTLIPLIVGFAISIVIGAFVATGIGTGL